MKSSSFVLYTNVKKILILSSKLTVFLEAKMVKKSYRNFKEKYFILITFSLINSLNSMHDSLLKES